MIEFIEKEMWTDTHPYIGDDLIPVFMVKDGVEYFVMNRRAFITGGGLYGAQGDEDLKIAKYMLMQNGGRYFTFIGDADPADMLQQMQKRGHTFRDPDTLFDKCDEKCYGGGFTDFRGNRNEVSAAFHYRIYDNEFAEALIKQALNFVDRSRT